MTEGQPGSRFLLRRAVRCGRDQTSGPGSSSGLPAVAACRSTRDRGGAGPIRGGTLGAHRLSREHQRCGLITRVVCETTQGSEDVTRRRSEPSSEALRRLPELKAVLSEDPNASVKVTFTLERGGAVKVKVEPETASED